MSDTRKPWAGEFPIDDPADMDQEAVDVLLRSVFPDRYPTPRYFQPKDPEPSK